MVFVGAKSLDDVTVSSTALAGYWSIDTGDNVVLVKGLLTGAMADVTFGGTTYGWQPFLNKTLAISVFQSTSQPNQQLVGGRLGDNLYGTGGGSTFWGGRGDDSIIGDGDNNTYVFERGDGHDTVEERSRTNPTGTVKFGTGIAVDDLMLSYYGSRLQITLRGSPGDQIDLTGFNASNPSASLGIAQFSFSDGQTLSYQSLLQRGIAIGGSAGNDTLAGTSNPDTLDGGAGNDVLSGKQGADTYLFGRGGGSDLIADADPQAGDGDRLLLLPGVAVGDLAATRYQNDLVLRIAETGDSVRLKDYFVPGSPDKVELIQFDDGSQLSPVDVDALIALHAGEPILGGSGSDILYGTAGNDLLDGAAGDDLIYGDAGDDTLTGSAGQDTMYGGAGSDTYIVGPASGWDAIDETLGGDASSVDALRFVGAVKRQSMSFYGSGTDLVVNDDADNIHVTLKGQFQGTTTANQIERFVFDDGTVLTAQDIKNQLLSGSPSSDGISGFDSDDDLSGGYGHDALSGAAGNDRLHGDEGNDVLDGGSGDDSLYGDAGDDALYGGDGNDLLDGGSGRDRLDGGAGDDAYQFGVGQGNDIIAQDASGFDTVQLGAGIAAANVALYRVSSPPANDLPFSGDSLVIQLNGGSDQLWVANYFASATQGYIERIRFADGTSWDYAAVTARLASSGGTPNTMTATNKADTFVIDHWNDVINDPSPTSGDKATSSVSYRLPDPYLASFTLTGALNLFAVPGNSQTPIYGNAGDNYFESVGSPYTLTYSGGKGNDVYLTRTNADSVTTGMNPASLGNVSIVEQAGEGVDAYMSGYWSAQLPANVENLTLVKPNPVSNNNLTFYGYGTNDFTHKLVGNALNNVIDSTLYEDNLFGQWWYFYRNVPLTGADKFRLDGGAGADTLIGGGADDTYVVDGPGDVIVENGVAKNGVDLSNDTIETPFETTLAQYPHIENITLVGNAAVNATADARANRLDGSQNSAANRLIGGAGDDTYVVGVGDAAVEQPGEGNDTVVIAATASALVRLSDHANVESLRLAGNLGAVDAQGDGGPNLIGSLGNNRLSGGDGDDALFDQFSADTMTYYGRIASADSDLLQGEAGNDVLTTFGGNDTLDGGAGDDSLVVYGRYAAYSGVQPSTVTLRFGLGDGHDTLARYADSKNTYAVEFKPGVGVADVQASAEGTALVLTLPDGSSLRLPGAVDSSDPSRLMPGFSLSLGFADGVRLEPQSVQALLRTTDRATPTDLDDVLIGTAGDDVINALNGNDWVSGAGGNDRLDGGASNDTVYGGVGVDTLAGGAGNDVLAGGAGTDSYLFSRGFGKDVIDDLLGSAGDDGAVDGVEFDATIAVSDVAVYRLVSGSTPVGLVLAVPASGDSVDLSHTYTAGTPGAIELVRFSNGTQWDLNAMKSRITGEVGGAGNDTLNGTTGADVLDGRGGDDIMTGLAGDDTYSVDSAGDQVVEASSGGTDTLISTIDYTLPANVERLVLAGAAPLRGWGNALNNVLTGNAGNNRLDGGGGADTMAGGTGDDTYVVDNTGDAVTEQPGEGIDTVESSITCTLTANVEKLVLTGTGKISGTGNALDNVLIGNSAVNSLNGGAGNDWLDGGAGADAMTGGSGDDTYVVDASNDKVVESAGGGYDTVRSSITYTLPTEVERLFLTGSSAINGTGNALSDWLIGNDAVNTVDGAGGNDVLLGMGGNDSLQDTVGNNAFDGGAGDDTLKAGAGNDLLAAGTGIDTLTLGAGADVICFNALDRTETVAAPVAGAGAGERNDTLSMGRAWLSQLVLSRDGSDLLVKLNNNYDSLRLQGWYTSSANQTVARLQWIVDSTGEYSAGSTDVLRNSKVLELDFGQLVSAFDAARAANPSLTNWTPSNAQLAAARLGSSDTAAYGGALAYGYAHDGTLANVGVATASDQMSVSGFGTVMQAIASSGAPGGNQPVALSAQGLTADTTALAAQAAPLAGSTQALEMSTLPDPGGTVASASDAPAADTPSAPSAIGIAAPQPALAAEPHPHPIGTTPTPLDEAAFTPLVPFARLPGSTRADTLIGGQPLAHGGGAKAHGTAMPGPLHADSGISESPVHTGAPAAAITPSDLESARAGHVLFPASPLQRAAMAAPSDAEVRRATRSRGPGARSAWDAVDAWSALQRSSSAPSLLQATEHHPASETSVLAAAGDDTLSGRMPAWQVKRIEQATRFTLAHFE